MLTDVNAVEPEDQHGEQDPRARRAKSKRLLFLAVAAILIAGVVAAVTISRTRSATTGPGATATTVAPPVTLTEVPTSIPPQGVSIDNGNQLWMPPAATDQPTISSDQAVGIVQKMANNAGVTFSQPLLVRDTIPSTEPPEGGSPGVSWLDVNDRLVWVVVATAPQPQSMPMMVGRPPESGETVPTIVAQNDNFVIDATTGKMIIGWFTK